MSIGVDVGGTKTHAIALDDAGRTAAQARVATGRGAGGVLESTRSVIRELATATGTPGSSPSASGSRASSTSAPARCRTR